MNTYLIPVTETYGYNYDYISCVQANTPQEAYLTAKKLPEVINYDHIVSNNENTYETYNNKLYIPKNSFHISEKNDIITILFKNTKGYKYMSFFNVNWNNYTEQLAQIALQESWSNKTYPNNGILANYIVKTYNKLQSEKIILVS